MQETPLKRSRPRQMLTIGQLAEQTGCNVPAIRYYEEIGLLPQPKRREGGHRIYNALTVELLMFIRQCRELGFPLNHIRNLIELSSSDDEDCGAVRDLAQRRLEMVRAKLAELTALEANLERYIGACSSGCSNGPAPRCSILQDIAQPDGNSDQPCCG